MCGIGGVARLDGSDLDESADRVLAELADILRHRGPDDRELLRDGPVGMAFTRLSLVDPQNGRQPLVSDDGSLVLIANGEVYNHRELAARLPGNPTFRTGSDCEVLLHLYQQLGENFLRDVRGMFGLILWDRRRGQLVLARDRFGIKPLYFHRNDQRIVLSSEIKGLFSDPATPREIDWHGALSSQAMAAAPQFSDAAQLNWFSGVQTVPAATVVRIDLADGRTTSHQYWAMPIEFGESRDAETYVEAYREILVESVRECATADTELGLFLSGGIDSAAVLAVAASQVDELHTFTATTGGTVANGDVEAAAWLAETMGVANHQVVFPEDLTPTPDAWRRLVWLTETPLCGPEIYYKHELHRYARAERPQLRGMLLGAASDEFNGGYSPDLAGDQGWKQFELNLRTTAVSSGLRSSPGLRPWWSHARPMLKADAIAARAGSSDDVYRQYLLSEYRKIQQYNVWHEDRTAAGSGIEARVPFLDHRLVELSAAIPPELRPQLLWDKRLLRMAVKDLLPERIVQRPKVPFLYGRGTHHAYRMLVRMLRRDNYELVERAGCAPGAQDYLDLASIRRNLDDLGDSPTSSAVVELMVRLVNLGLLSEMAHDVPLLEKLDPSPVLLAAPADSREITARIGSAGLPKAESVLALREGALALTDPVSGLWYLLVDGVIEYEFDEQAAILTILREMDGTRSLDELLRIAGGNQDDVEDELLELMTEGMVIQHRP